MFSDDEDCGNAFWDFVGVREEPITASQRKAFEAGWFAAIMFMKSGELEDV